MSFAGVWRRPSQSTDRFQSLKKLVRPPNPETVLLFCPPDARSTLANLLGRQSNTKTKGMDDSYMQNAASDKKVRIGTANDRRKHKAYKSIDLGRRHVNVSISSKVLSKPDVHQLEYHMPMTEIKSKNKTGINLFQSFEEQEAPKTEEKLRRGSAVKIKPFKVARQSFLDEDIEAEQSWLLKRLENFKRSKDTLSYKYQFVSTNMSIKNLEDPSKQGQMWDSLIEKINQTSVSMLEIVGKSATVETKEIIQLCDVLLSKASHCLG